MEPADNIAARQLETQREKLKLDRAALELAGKQAKMQKIAVISALLTVIISSAHFIYSIVTSSGHP